MLTPDVIQKVINLVQQAGKTTFKGEDKKNFVLKSLRILMPFDNIVGFEDAVIFLIDKLIAVEKGELTLNSKLNPFSDNNKEDIQDTMKEDLLNEFVEGFDTTKFKTSEKLKGEILTPIKKDMEEDFEEANQETIEEAVEEMSSTVIKEDEITDKKITKKNYYLFCCSGFSKTQD